MYRVAVNLQGMGPNFKEGFQGVSSSILRCNEAMLCISKALDNWLRESRVQEKN